MADRSSQLAGRPIRSSTRSSVKAASPDRTSSPSADRRSALSNDPNRLSAISTGSNEVPNRKSVKSLRMSYIAARQSLLTTARQSRQSLMPPPSSRIKQRRQAKEMEKAVQDRAKRLGQDPPPYEFLEMIGKGTFGRVFKR